MPALTHIRQNGATGTSWKAICGVENPESSVGIDMIRLIKARLVPDFPESGVTPCQKCHDEYLNYIFKGWPNVEVVQKSENV